MLKKVQQHLKRYLLLYVSIAMALGLLLGHPQAVWTKAHKAEIKALTTVVVFFIIYPMMVNLKLESLAKAGRNWKGLTLALAYNFLWAPIFGYLLAKGFLHDPLLALGFLLVMVVPCSSMSIGYTGLAEGNVELATVTVALSFLVAVVAVPLWMSIFAGQYEVTVPIHDMLMSILEVLIAPMVLGYLTRLALVRRYGEKKYREWQPFFPSLSLLAMFAIVFVIFFAKATVIVDKWQTVLLLLVPETLFFLVTLSIITLLNRWMHIPYEEHMALVFASAGKNNGTAIAIAATAFSPLVAVPAAVMPVFQIFFLVTYLKLADPLGRYFGLEEGILSEARS
ncbi:MAG TPA: arsenic resistance protein [Chloroflexi bacterium]|nr:arsenic resistance protein [Chloroflexota bacterium]